MRPITKIHRCTAAAAITLAAIATTRPAAAQSQARIDLSAPADGAVIAGSLVGTWLVSSITTEKGPWSRELFSFDEPTRGTFSRTHGIISDALIATTILTPIVANFAIDDPDALRKLVVTGEALAVGVFLNAVAKYTVQRPRPYTYSTEPLIEKYARDRGTYSYLSFFSSHSTNAFAGAVSGSLLFAYGNSDTDARAVIWGLEMAFASATATERVRAGQHFPTDVLLGAAVGTGIGILVPRAHMRDRSAIAMQPEEWAAIGCGLVVGTTIAAALPSFHWPQYETRTMSLHLAPTFSNTGASLTARGAF